VADEGESLMAPQPESACLVIADISGYTSFLAGVELDHAHDIIADLMDTIVRGLRPVFRVAKFEGDAVFVYALAEKVDGSLLQDAVEASYFAFRRRLRTIKQATTCECKACSQMQMLDLKFVGHHGEFIRHRMVGREELAGRDVILDHRLLKNDVSERLHGHAYALYTQSCVEALGIDPLAQGLVEHRESIDIIGDVACWVRDLEDAWAMDIERRRHEVTRDSAVNVLEFEIAAPRPIVWEYFVMPDLRPKWRAADEVREATADGRRGIGTTNHCMHGAHAIIEEVIDWHPFDYLTLTTLLPMPGASKVTLSYAFLDRADGGTHVEIRVAKPKPKDRAFLEQVGPTFAKTITDEVVVLRGLIEDAPVPDQPEPMLPVSAERFLTTPVNKH
jgi:uncharacterized protein YndB with AHSA1/START domain